MQKTSNDVGTNLHFFNTTHSLITKKNLELFMINMVKFKKNTELSFAFFPRVAMVRLKSCIY